MARILFVAALSSLLASLVLAAPTSEDGTSSPVPNATHEGHATYYEVGGTAGACGYRDSDSDHVVAISHLIYGSGGYCNQWIQIKNKENGKTQYGKTRDECEGCGRYDLDLSPSLFKALGEPLGKGEFNIEWQFMAKGWSP